MRTAAVILAVVIGVLGLVPTPAHAAPQGPFCFSTLPFSDVFVFFIDGNGGNQFIATGRDLLTNSGVSATLFITGNFAVLSFVAPASPDSHSSMGTATVDLSTGSGPGVCETVNTGLGCGVGSNFTMTLVTCPAGSLSSAQQSPSGTGNLMGGIR